jgi:glycosyltransferase involved in cell wall biosynthesis
MKLEECRAALVHHWFFGMTGGERVCEAICEILGTPDLFAILADEQSLSPVLRLSKLTTSFVQRVPGARTLYRYYVWMFPLAVEQFDLRPYDLVITSDANTVKGVLVPPETCHICYCHSPMRYAWNMFQEYRRGSGMIRRNVVSLVMHYLRLWDYCAAARVDYFVANSQTVRNRIRKYYRRDARVISPPCDLDRFKVSQTPENYYLFVGRLVYYKRADLAVTAFGTMQERLLVVGEGPQMNHLKSIAGKNVEFLGHIPDRDLADLYSRCTALIFPGEEDFGIVPVEAQASGRPVIAYAAGGALETVVPYKTGLFFPEQTPESLIAAVKEFQKNSDTFDPAVLREHAKRFGKDRFVAEFREHAQKCLDEHMQDFRQKKWLAGR